MKKVFVTAILSMAAAASTFAQSVFFNNIGSSTDAIVTYGPGTDGANGTGVLSTYTAGLYYALGNVTWTDSYPAGIPQVPVGFTLVPSAIGTFNADALAGPGGEGYFDSGTFATIPAYTSGQISFVMVAYEGASYASAAYRGHSTSFTLSQIATGQAPVGEFGAGLTSFSVLPVPEPSTFALAGLGLASLVILRRRK